MHWPTHPLTRGSYACYTVGQWTTIRGHEFPAADGLYFAGSHTSLTSQGYMEGAAATGYEAAQALLAEVR